MSAKSSPLTLPLAIPRFSFHALYLLTLSLDAKLKRARVGAITGTMESKCASVTTESLTV